MAEIWRYGHRTQGRSVNVDICVCVFVYIMRDCELFLVSLKLEGEAVCVLPINIEHFDC